MDAAGAEQASLLGGLDGGVVSILFAIAYPGRVDRLITYCTPPRIMRAPDYPWGVGPEDLERLFGLMEEDWGGPAFLQIAAPSVADDRRFVRWFGRFQRSAVGPAAATAWMRSLAQVDIRDVLDQVAVPTLVLQRANDLIVGVEHGRYLARHIPHATYVELPGEYLLWVGDTDLLLDEVQEFVTGIRAELEPERVVRTVLFTDIVGSTELATHLGDRRWCDLLEAHHRVVRRNLERFGGVEVDTAGDGFFAIFDGPARAIRCAAAVRDEVRSLGIEIRAGLHAGEVEIRGESVAGLAVHIGAACVRPSPRPEQWSSPAPFEIPSPVRDSSSKLAANTRSRACPARGGCSWSPQVGDEERRQATAALVH